MGGLVPGKGISWPGSVLETAIKYEVVEKRGSWLSFQGEHIGQGHEAACALLDGNAEMLGKMIDEIHKKIHPSG